MRPSKFTDEEIVGALRRVRAGTPAVQVFADPLFFSAMQNDSTARDLATELARCEEAAQR